MTLDRVEEILQEEIQKAKAIGIEVGNIDPKVKTMRAISKYADIHRDKVDKKYFTIRISEYFLEAPEMLIRTTIMHEVLHSVEGCLDHQKKWRNMAEKVNSTYEGYKITRLDQQCEGYKKWSLRKHSDKKVAACRTSREVRHLLRCTECDYEIARTRHSRATLHPEWYRCPKCHGSLYLVF